MKLYPSFEEFLKLSQKGNLIPVYAEILGDLETPVSAYFKLAQKAAYSFLLESVEGEEKVARYSFLAKDPQLVFSSKGTTAEILHLDSSQPRREKKTFKDSPLEIVRELMAVYRFVPVKGLPRFCGGMVGFMGYDVVRFFERLPDHLKDDLQLPDMLFVLSKNLVIFDNRNHKIKVVSCVQVDEDASLEQKKKKFDEAVTLIEQWVKLLRAPLVQPQSPLPESSKEAMPVSNVSQDDFIKMVQHAKRKIKQGDIIQVVLSQRFSLPITTSPFSIYRALRGLNPSPYMYYLNLKDVQLIGSSPELLVRCEDGLVETRPIAGTRRRGKNEKEDAALTKDLLSDPKEKAEHIMLVDLGRNDLGRVCRQGTVKISEFMAVEKYSHVMHIVSNVQGKLRGGLDGFDVLKAAFPAGTVSGAPKIRAMAIIEELENVRRGPYAGAIGYFSFSGNLDSCITIRTIVVKDKKAYVQAGAGIVSDSQPKKEYIETVNKARAQLMAIALAHRDIS